MRTVAIADIITRFATSAPKTYPVIDPVTGEEFARAPECGADQLDTIMAEANASFRKWSIDESVRRALMLEFAEAIDSARGELAALVAKETGKPLFLAETEPDSCAAWLRYYAGMDLPQTRVPDGQGSYVELLRKPLGVVAAITPWNFPLVLALWKIAPALRAGNTVVLKPSPFTPLSSLYLGEIANRVLPAGVLTVVSGGDELGQRMTTHPTPRKVSFTGSVVGGKSVAAAAGADLKRVTLELGGNDAVIVLDDADVPAIVPAIAAAAFLNSGQACALPKRVFVPRTLYAEALDAFVAAAQTMQKGMTPSEDRTFGPLSTRPQFDRVLNLLDDALAAGAVCATGGGSTRDSKGYFVEPTILTNATDELPIVAEEQFGPVLPILAYDHLDDAIQRANNTRYGLAASVWGKDLDQAVAVASQLEAGTVWINNHAAYAMNVPFGGVKWSGIGLENGVDGLLAYTDQQGIYVPQS